MENDDFERKIKTKLDSWETEPPADMWNRIQKVLPAAPAPTHPIIYRPILWSAVAAALTGIIVWFSLPFENFISDRTAQPFTQTLSPDIPVYPQDEKPNIAATEAFISEISPTAKTSTTIYNISGCQNIEHPKKAAFFSSRENTATSAARFTSNNRTNNKEARINTYSSNYFINENTSENNLYTDAPQQRKHHSGKYSIGIMAVNPLSKNNTTTNRHSALSKSIPLTSSFLSTNNPNKEDLKWSHNVPLTFGITIEKRLTQSIGIETGITYSFLKSEYKNTNNSRYGNQELHYIGIPITGIYRFAHWNNFTFYSAIGVKADFNVAGNRTDKVNGNYNGFRFQGDMEANTTKSIRDPKAQFSLMCKLGAAYCFIDHLELYTEPGLAYFFNNENSEIQSIWKDKPLNFALQVGLRTNF